MTPRRIQRRWVMLSSVALLALASVALGQAGDPGIRKGVAVPVLATDRPLDAPEVVAGHTATPTPDVTSAVSALDPAVPDGLPSMTAANPTPTDIPEGRFGTPGGTSTPPKVPEHDDDDDEDEDDERETVKPDVRDEDSRDDDDESDERRDDGDRDDEDRRRESDSEYGNEHIDVIDVPTP